MNPSRGNAHFGFCSGFENSYPIITDHRGLQLRRDGLELSRHYEHWRHDLKLVAEMGLQFLRYGPPYYRCHAGPEKYEWSFPDKTFKLLRELKIEPITDLCHFGVPDWLGGAFQNPDWPEAFAQYARAFALRFPWVRLYTPVNEILIAAEFSALNGWWNEQLKDERAFITALKHLCRANVLAEQAILEVRPDALFIQSESSLYYHAAVPAAIPAADFLSQRRFIALDLCYGHPVDSNIFEYLLDNGLSRQEYRWFMEQAPPLLSHCIMGSDYYVTNEKKVNDAKGTLEGCGEVMGYYEITKQYYHRYRLPVFHTETNRKDESRASAWLWKEWFNVLKLRAEGLPILGFTWFSFFDQTDWDVELREDNYRVNPMGLYDLNRKIRPVGKTYRQIIREWQPFLSAELLHRDLCPSGTPGAKPRKPPRARGKQRVHQERSPKPRDRKTTDAEG